MRERSRSAVRAVAGTPSPITPSYAASSKPRSSFFSISRIDCDGMTIEPSSTRSSTTSERTGPWPKSVVTSSPPFAAKEFEASLRYRLCRAPHPLHSSDETTSSNEPVSGTTSRNCGGVPMPTSRVYWALR